MNKKVLENLVKSGAFDATSFSRNELLNRIPFVMKAAQQLQKDKDSNQLNLFAVKGKELALEKNKNNRPEFPVNQRLAYEREALGFYISGHPLTKYSHVLKSFGAVSTVMLREKKNNSPVKIAGVVTALRLRNTKKGDRYASFVLEDAFGTVEAIVWPDVYRDCSVLLAQEDPVFITGKADINDERCVLVVDVVQSLIALRDAQAHKAILKLTVKDNFSGKFEQLMEIFTEFKGNCPVLVQMSLEGEQIQIALRDKNNKDVCLSASESVCDKVEALFGAPRLSFVS
jgi:DNA polymerase-3 subunit alpha